MKTCFKCGAEKERSEFYAHPGMADGLLGKCKTCTKNDARERRNGNLEAIREYDRKRSYLPHRVADRVRRLREETEKHPEIIRARHAVNNALRDGKITKAPCEVCGKKRVEAHHDDYSKPLEVRWLCKPHHWKADEQRRKAA